MGKQIIHEDRNYTKAIVDVIIGKQGDYYVAYCPALELSSYGSTEAKAKRNFEVDLEIFFEETVRRGSLKEILFQLGWKLIQSPLPVYTPPTKPKYSELLHAPKTFQETVAIPF